MTPGSPTSCNAAPLARRLLARRLPETSGGPGCRDRGGRDRGGRAIRRAAAALGLALLSIVTLGIEAARAQEASPPPAPPLAMRTDSPRETISSFAVLRDALEAELIAYRENKSVEGARRLAILSDQFNALIDLSQVPEAARRETGIATWSYLIDIFGRIALPDPATVPDAAAYEAGGETSYRLGETPIRIVRMTEGERVDEYLFSAGTVQVAPRFFRAIAHLPLESRLDIESFTDFSPQLTGPLVPAGFYRAMPEALTRLWLGTPLWKVIGVALVLAALLGALLALHRVLGLWSPAGRLPALLWSGLRPLAMLAAGGLALPAIAHQVNVSGGFASITDAARILLSYAAYAWLAWIGIRMLFELVIRSPSVPDESLDANLLRLLSGVLGIVAVVIIVAFGAQAIGLPILSVLAGLGVGGLAVALALRPTLENLIGGVILYVDRPVRVGDFCSFGGLMGTVESIGVRSTKLRALDRTMITVPNAQFADMQLVNWAYCDEMLILDTIGLRYETEPDQLRYVLASLRRTLLAHPRLNAETVRVRFAGYAESALKIEIRVYAETREWNDFFAIREDVYLRIYEVVREAGTGFAFPSRMVYAAEEHPVDAEKTASAKRTVHDWRRSGRLPFPRFPREEIDRLERTLDYPPRGSYDERREDPEEAGAVEPLSAPDQRPKAAEGEAAEGSKPDPQRRT